MTTAKLPDGLDHYFGLKIDIRTPLQIAVHNEDLEIIRILFRYNADPNAIRLLSHPVTLRVSRLLQTV